MAFGTSIAQPKVQRLLSISHDHAKAQNKRERERRTLGEIVQHNHINYDLGEGM